MGRRDGVSSSVGRPVAFSHLPPLTFLRMLDPVCDPCVAVLVARPRFSVRPLHLGKGSRVVTADVNIAFAEVLDSSCCQRAFDIVAILSCPHDPFTALVQSQHTSSRCRVRRVVWVPLDSGDSPRSFVLSPPVCLSRHLAHNRLCRHLRNRLVDHLGCVGIHLPKPTPASGNSRDRLRHRHRNHCLALVPSKS